MMTKREIKSLELNKEQARRERLNEYARRHYKELRERANAGDEYAKEIFRKKSLRAKERNDRSLENAKRHYRTWTYEEVTYLEQNRFKKTAAEMALELGRTIASVRAALARYYVCGDYDLEVTINSIRTGEKIAKYIVERGMTTKDVAEKVGGISENAVKQWIKGRTLPTVDNLFRLAHALHVNVSSLIVRDVRKRVTE